MIAFDTNLLVYDFNLDAQENSGAAEAIDRAVASGRGWGLTLASAVEFWNLVTRPSAALGTAAEANQYLLDLQSMGAQIWLPRSGFAFRLPQSAQQYGIHGRRIFDWQIALMALENGATELWTHDRGFCAPGALRIFDPLA
ncbi:MAG: type II toxin-antitoxin system VapC family toxin [Terriglobales bacterium]